MAILQLKVIMKLKNSLQGLNNSFKLTEERISTLENRMTNIVQLQNREKKNEENECIREMWTPLSAPIYV